MSFKRSIYASASEVNVASKTATPISSPWVRNPLWPAVATPVGEEILGLFAVYPDRDNFFSCNIAVSAGTVSIERGDGGTTTQANGVQFNYNYDYTNTSLYSDPGLPYKIAIIRITPTTGGATFSSASLSTLHNQAGLQTAYSNGWLEVKVAHTVCNNVAVSGAAITPQLENVEVYGGAWVPSNGFLGTSSRSLRRAVVQLSNSTNFSLSGLFADCVSLTDVSLSFTGAGRPNDCSAMFRSNRSLTAVPLFDTSAATNMTSMFDGCATLTTVPLFNTVSVTNMTSMFNACSSLTTVPLFNTVSVTNMTSMFNSCGALTSVPLFNTASVTNMSNMFASCTSLKNVPLLNTAAVTNMSNMFNGCDALEEVPLFNTAAVTNMSSMLRNCNSLQTVPLFNTASVTTMANMFQASTRLRSIPQFNMAAVTSVVNVFASCSALSELPALNLTGVSSAANFNSFVGGTRLFKLGATGARFTHSIANNCLSATELNAYYTNLPTVTGQTLTVTGNYGTATDNPAIATAKGWTVTG